LRPADIGIEASSKITSCRGSWVNVPSLAAKVVTVHGSNTGIGKEHKRSVASIFIPAGCSLRPLKNRGEFC